MSQKPTQQLDVVGDSEVVTQVILRESVVMVGMAGNTQIDSVKTPNIRTTLLPYGLRFENKKGGQVCVVPFSGVKSFVIS